MSVSAFGALGVPGDLCACLTASGIVEPFPIQSAVIPDALAGRDVTGRAPTGSGKTLAFGIPVVANLKRGGRKRPTALVLAPTRELAEQIATELRPLAKTRRHDVVSVYGGVGYGPQRKTVSTESRSHQSTRGTGPRPRQRADTRSIRRPAACCCW
jgi:superfamily II DNA/RNA helicase